MATLIEAIKNKATTDSVQKLIDKVVPQPRGTLDNFQGVFQYGIVKSDFIVGRIEFIDINSGDLLGYGSVKNTADSLAFAVGFYWNDDLNQFDIYYNESAVGSIDKGDIIAYTIIQ